MSGKTIKRNLGGDRLGSGNKMELEMHNFYRSTHDLGYLWRSTMAPGTLVPFINEVGLPGDKFYIELDADVKTYPTVGPLFGSFKLQLDVFVCPVRLYQGKLHNNKLGIGMEMSKVKLPQLRMPVKNITNWDANNRPTKLDNWQTNPSSLLAYLGIRGTGNAPGNDLTRDFNAVPYLAYYDIGKNYYANKQEENAYVIHGRYTDAPILRSAVIWETDGESNEYPDLNDDINRIVRGGTWIVVRGRNLNGQNVVLVDQYGVEVLFDDACEAVQVSGGDVSGRIRPGTGWTLSHIQVRGGVWRQEILLTKFPLENIDTMRENILTDTKSAGPFMITKDSIAPYGLPLEVIDNLKTTASFLSQEGLMVKTYQSDLFNNWLNTEWIDGENGISAITAIDTSDGLFTIDTLNLSQKIYDMLNRIAVSGGTYNDWMEAVYGHDGVRMCETPMYMGGLSKEVVFQEVVSTAETGDGTNPLGSLAGKGSLGRRNKGGKLSFEVEEPSVIIGIASLTPRIDYSQGNNWAVNLKSMDDFHKPSLDAIGFQELITEQMHWADTWITPDGQTNKINFKSAGKQPAWINYMTNYNKCYGEFANPESEMFMTLNRRYSVKPEAINTDRLMITDLTTYIDPSKFNYAFAYTAIDAQNFWVQIGVDMTARRKMSAKVIPNL